MQAESGAGTLKRLLYSSRSTSQGHDRQADVQAILATARSYNPRHGITGILTECAGEYLQLLDGPAEQLEALFERIRGDARHSDVDVLALHPVEQPAFPDWAMVFLERSEPADPSAANGWSWKGPRLRADETRLLRSALMPGAPSVGYGRQPPRVALFLSASGLWGPAVLQRVASENSSPTLRTSATEPEAHERRTLVECVDTTVDGVGAVRAMSIAGRGQERWALLPWLDRPDLVVLLMTPSDLSASRVAELRALCEKVGAMRSDVLVCSRADDAQLAPLLQQMNAAAVKTRVARVRLAESEAVWQAVVQSLRELGPKPPELVAAESAVALAQLAATLVPRLMGIQGVKQALLLPADPQEIGAWTAQVGEHGAELAALVEMMQRERALLRNLARDDSAEEITFTTGTSMAVYRPLSYDAPDGAGALILLDRAAVQLATARLLLREALAGEVPGQE